MSCGKSVVCRQDLKEGLRLRLVLKIYFTRALTRCPVTVVVKRVSM